MMTETECIEELKAKGFKPSQLIQGGAVSYYLSSWMMQPTAGGGWGLWWYGGTMARATSLPEMFGAKMPNSASVTVAAYFGLRNPGVG